MEGPQPKASTTPTANTEAAEQGSATSVDPKGMATRGKRKLEQALPPNSKIREPKKPKGANKPAATREPDSLRPAYRTTAEGRRGRERLAVDLLRLWEPFAHPGSRQ
jgi:hypothetical protein